MKKLVYVLPLLLTLAAGCLGNNNGDPIPDPAGTFSGEFRRITRNSNSTIDTLKANIKVIIEPGIGYHVLGDTSTIHAGSKGHYGIAGNGIKFVDDTYPQTGTPQKTHLEGEYLFVYNGSVFQMTRTSENLALQYDLKKTN
ncbi:hypothetical protein [Mucilaginibacter phyllosphaerae]|uniref:Lipoprotein n=1 Tax=Mucilaginibacter phyllosphaerae TaxID=1812349 RepID=A0A4Y8AKT7_9SPHI|nr:hypothetical protein [Mucilaginibacter phyllosphaerae]MBB3967835.1 hypothetical protein [Mucilaginibacter phyllosphaerae]TEW69121.1 hypothetical protein E2R65_02845 [Mucilaginibacter phyllosphaerae]GGH02986.1 hypothetical protein GCM10007352_05480 [Mucilaginibacter phyllosphaerae]